MRQEIPGVYVNHMSLSGTSTSRKLLHDVRDYPVGKYYTVQILDSLSSSDALYPRIYPDLHSVHFHMYPIPLYTFLV